MSTKQLNRREGFWFWPFDDWFPEEPDPQGGKPNPTVGDASRYASTKNYPSLARAPIEEEEKSENQTRPRKRSRGKKSS